MEQQEKKKRKNYRRRRQSKSTSSFPIDLHSEILLRLPLKSVVRFRCVSKIWSSITTDPYFIKTWSPRSTSILICIRKYDNLFVCLIPQVSNRSYSSSQPQPIDLHHMKLPGNNTYFSPHESVHGLICFLESGNPVVWNPLKRQFLNVPKLEYPGKSKVSVFLGYDPVQGKHKLVRIPYNKFVCVCKVLTLGSAQESWRTVVTRYTHISHFRTSWRCIKGVIYYLTYSGVTFGLVLMSFDVRSEKFDMIELPSDILSDHELINYGGRLACADINNGKRLWILEDAEKHKWSSQDFLVPFGHSDENLGTYFSLKGITHAGEFIYAPNACHKSFYILFFDPMRNSCRRFEFKGIADDEFWLNNGVPNYVYELHAFPNHIETQMSL